MLASGVRVVRLAQGRFPGIRPCLVACVDSFHLVWNRGFGARGRHLIATVPQDRWQTTIFIATLRQDTITAPLVLDRAIDGTSFLAYVRQFPVPTLHPGDIVVMDNPGSHKDASIHHAIEKARARLLHLPSYSQGTLRGQ